MWIEVSDSNFLNLHKYSIIESDIEGTEYIIIFKNPGRKKEEVKLSFSKRSDRDIFMYRIREKLFEARKAQKNGNDCEDENRCCLQSQCSGKEKDSKFWGASFPPL